VGGDEAEAEVDCVACVVGIVSFCLGLVWVCAFGCEKLVGLLDLILPVCMLTKLPQMKTLLLSKRPVMM
jgi:hypothetical protein